MGHTPFHWQSLTALAHLAQSGTLSPVDLTEHFLTRLEALDDTLHAFRLVTRERAGRGAGAARPASWSGGRAIARHSIRRQGFV